MGIARLARPSDCDPQNIIPVLNFLPQSNFPQGNRLFPSIAEAPYASSGRHDVGAGGNGMTRACRPIPDGDGNAESAFGLFFKKPDPKEIFSERNFLVLGLGFYGKSKGALVPFLPLGEQSYRKRNRGRRF